MAHVAFDASGGAAVLSDRPRLRGRQLGFVLAALMLTLLLAALDQTIVSTALPHILGELNGLDRYTWVVTAYLLTETTVIPIIGKLSDQFGRKWFVIAGIVIFLVGSALSGASQTMNQLIAFRAVQGIGAGFLFALIFTLVGDIFTPAERARWQGLFSGVFALASVVGPTLGGWITDTTTWRWVFYVNLPLGAVAFLLILFCLPSNISVRSSAKGSAWKRIDIVGALTAATATVCLLVGLTWGGQTYPWSSWQVVSILVAAIVLFAAFLFAERFAREPILPLDLFKNQVFAAGALLSLTVGMALYAVIIYLPLFLQGVQGQSATNSGAEITPITLTMAIGSAVIGLVIAKIGRYQFLSVIGAIVMTFGVFLFARLTASSTPLEVTRDMIVVGLGLGMLQPVLTLAVQNAIPRTRLGTGTSAVTYLRTLGQTLGTAVIGAIVNSDYSHFVAQRLPAQASQLPPKLLSAATSQEVLANPSARTAITQAATAGAVKHGVPAAAIQSLMQQIFEAARQALALSIQHAFAAGLIVCVVIVVITLFLKDVPLSKREAPAVASAPANTAAPTLGPAEVAAGSTMQG